MRLSEAQLKALRPAELSEPRVLVRTAAYPKARARIGSVMIAGAPVIGPVVAGGGVVAPAVVSPSGSTLTLGQTSAAGATDVLVSTRIPFPFIVRHVQLQTDSAVAVAAATRVKVASDNSIAGGLATAGQDIEIYGGTAQLFSNFGKILDCYPNFRVTAANQFIKVIYNNLGAGNVAWQYVVDIEHLG